MIVVMNAGEPLPPWLPLLPYKLQMAVLLADAGAVSRALQYCAVVDNALRPLVARGGPAALPPFLLVTASQAEALRERLVGHAAALGLRVATGGSALGKLGRLLDNTLTRLMGGSDAPAGGDVGRGGGGAAAAPALGGPPPPPPPPGGVAASANHVAAAAAAPPPLWMQVAPHLNAAAQQAQTGGSSSHAAAGAGGVVGQQHPTPPPMMMGGAADWVPGGGAAAAAAAAGWAGGPPPPPAAAHPAAAAASHGPSASLCSSSFATAPPSWTGGCAPVPFQPGAAVAIVMGRVGNGGPDSCQLSVSAQ